MKKMRVCSVCHSYTLREIHCSKNTESAHPARFKARDRYGRYRRSAKYGG